MRFAFALLLGALVGLVALRPQQAPANFCQAVWR